MDVIAPACADALETTVATKVHPQVQELNCLELALVGGGMGEVVCA
jgi:hypothetical protein